MTTAVEDLAETSTAERRVPYTALAVAITGLAVVLPGGRVPLADYLLMIIVLMVILRAVTRHPGFTQLFDEIPSVAKWAAKLVLAAFLIGQLWGSSEQTFPVATWTMYSHDPGAEAVVYRFDAVTAAGDAVVFTPSAFHRTLPAKMALVHLRRLSGQVYRSSISSDPAQLAAAEAKLERALLAYIDLHNELTPGSKPVRIEAAHVSYDVTQEHVGIESGVRTVLLTIDLQES